MICVAGEEGELAWNCSGVGAVVLTGHPALGFDHCLIGVLWVHVLDLIHDVHLGILLRIVGLDHDYLTVSQSFELRVIGRV